MQDLQSKGLQNRETKEIDKMTTRRQIWGASIKATFGNKEPLNEIVDSMPVVFRNSKSNRWLILKAGLGSKKALEGIRRDM